MTKLSWFEFNGDAIILCVSPPKIGVWWRLMANVDVSTSHVVNLHVTNAPVVDVAALSLLLTEQGRLLMVAITTNRCSSALSPGTRNAVEVSVHGSRPAARAWGPPERR